MDLPGASAHYTTAIISLRVIFAFTCAVLYELHQDTVIRWLNNICRITHAVLLCIIVLLYFLGFNWYDVNYLLISEHIVSVSLHLFFVMIIFACKSVWKNALCTTLLLEKKEKTFILHNKSSRCWWPGDAMVQGINSYVIDLAIRKIVVLRTNRIEIGNYVLHNSCLY